MSCLVSTDVLKEAFEEFHSVAATFNGKYDIMFDGLANVNWVNRLFMASALFLDSLDCSLGFIN